MVVSCLISTDHRNDWLKESLGMLHALPKLFLNNIAGNLEDMTTSADLTAIVVWSC